MKETYDSLLKYAQAYLQLAELGCQELLHQRHIKMMGIMTPYQSPILFPIIYNSKHGIECFLKVLQQIAGRPYDTIHHLHSLFTAVSDILLNRNWEPVEDNGDEITQDDINYLPNHLKKVEELVNYFYSNKIVAEKLKIPEIPDAGNELFRYPHMRNGTTFDHEAFLISLTQDDIKELKEKISMLYNHLNDIGYFLAVVLKN